MHLNTKNESSWQNLCLLCHTTNRKQKKGLSVLAELVKNCMYVSVESYKTLLLIVAFFFSRPSQIQFSKVKLSCVQCSYSSPPKKVALNVIVQIGCIFFASSKNKTNSLAFFFQTLITDIFENELLLQQNDFCFKCFSCVAFWKK